MDFGFIKHSCLLVGFVVMPLLSIDPIEYQVAGVRLVLCTGDITRQPVDAIVNAANDHMLGGGGVDGAIQAAAGPELVAYNLAHIPVVERANGADVRCPVGQVRVSPSFNLAHAGIRFIIHANGPRGTTPRRAELLEQCYRNAMEAASNPRLLKNTVKSDEGVIHSIAFPAISVGIFRYPLQEATDIAVRTVIDIIRQQKAHGQLNLNQVRFVLFDKDPATPELFRLYRQMCEHYLSGGPKPTVATPITHTRGVSNPTLKNSEDGTEARVERDPVKRQGLIRRFAYYLGTLAWRSVLRPVLSPVIWGARHVRTVVRALMWWRPKEQVVVE